MSSLSQAGKSTINRAFTKGLYGVDPQQLQRKQMEKRAYQEQLKKQAQQNQRRKAQQKAKQRQEDQKLQRKIQEDLLFQQRQKAEKDRSEKDKERQKQKQRERQREKGSNLKNSRQVDATNNSNIYANPQRKNLFNVSVENSLAKNTLSSPQISLYKNTDISNGNYQRSAQNYQPYKYAPKNVYDVEQERYLREQNQNRLRRFKQTLDRKVQEVYHQIQSSKKALDTGSIIDEIRRRLKSNSYVSQDFGQLQKSNVKHFEEEFSHFYKIPKRTNDVSFNYKGKTLKNLDYESQSKYKSSLRNYGQESRNLEQPSRFRTQRPQKSSEYNDDAKKWGNRRNNNFLGNRQALDYKMDSMLSNIDNIIDTQNRQQNTNY